MGNIITFKSKGYGYEHTQADPRSLAREFYHQCRCETLAEAINAKRANDNIKLSALAHELFRARLEEAIAIKTLDAQCENNPRQLEFAAELSALYENPPPETQKPPRRTAEILPFRPRA